MSLVESQSVIKLTFSSSKVIDISKYVRFVGKQPDISYQKGQQYLDWGIAKCSLTEFNYFPEDIFEGQDRALLDLIDFLISMRPALESIDDRGIDVRIGIYINKSENDDVGCDLSISTMQKMSSIKVSFRIYVSNNEIV
jgi:hypothetical protein